MKVSVVIPVFNEAEGLPSLYATLCAALDPLPHPSEVVFVDDAFRDGSAGRNGSAGVGKRLRPT